VKTFQLAPTVGEKVGSAVSESPASYKDDLECSNQIPFLDIANTSLRNPVTLISSSSAMGPKLASSVHAGQISVLRYLVFGAVIHCEGHHPSRSDDGLPLVTNPDHSLTNDRKVCVRVESHVNAAQLYTTISFYHPNLLHTILSTTCRPHGAETFYPQHSELALFSPGLSPSNESRIIAYAVYILTFTVLVYYVSDSFCVIPSCSRLRASRRYSELKRYCAAAACLKAPESASLQVVATSGPSSGFPSPCVRVPSTR
jgi:hypothetical protein